MAVTSMQPLKSSKGSKEEGVEKGSSKVKGGEQARWREEAETVGW